MAILALVLGLTTGLGGIICGHIAKKQIRETGEEGDGMATAGLVIGYIWAGLAGLGCLCYGVYFFIILGAIASGA